MKNLFSPAVVAAVVLCGSQTIQAATIDFEDVGVTLGSNTLGTDLNSGGYFFDASENETHRINGNVDYADSGSTYLIFHSIAGNNTLTMSPLDSIPFRLNSVQLAEGFSSGSGNSVENATSVLITGNLFGGGTVSTTITLDGINDGPGGVADFQLAVFNPTWDNLTSVVFDGIGGNDGRMGIENIVVNVPEPSSLALAGIGILALAWRRIVRKS